MKISAEQIITVISLIGAILAWIAKIRWSKEYKDAKDEIIRSKDSLILQLKENVQFYKDMTPMKMKEYFDTVKSELEAYNNLLSEKLKKAEEKNHAGKINLNIESVDSEMLELGKKIQDKMKQFDWIKQTEEWDIAEYEQNIRRNNADE